VPHQDRQYVELAAGQSSPLKDLIASKLNNPRNSVYPAQRGRWLNVNRRQLSSPLLNYGIDGIIHAFILL
jgi:hypothetical protein